MSQLAVYEKKKDIKEISIVILLSFWDYTINDHYCLIVVKTLSSRQLVQLYSLFTVYLFQHVK